MKSFAFLPDSRHLRMLIVFSVLIFTFSFASQAFADTPWGEQGVKLTNNTSNKSMSRSTVNIDNSLVSVWSQEMTTGLNKIYASRTGTGGEQLWGGLGKPVCGNTAGNQYAEGLVADGAGGIFAFWTDDRAGSGSSQIWAQYLGSDGSQKWDPKGVLVGSGSTTQQAPCFVSDGSGGSVAVWQSGPASDYSVWAQRLSADGAGMWGVTGKKISGISSTQMFTNPNVTRDNSGNFVVVWQTYDGSKYDVWGQRLDANGQGLWGSGGKKIASSTSTTIGHGAYPEITNFGGSGTVVAWQSYNSTFYSAWAQRLDSGGNPQWGAGKSLDSNLSNGAFPVLDNDPLNGSTAFSWGRYNGGTCDTQVQKLDSNGNPLWGAGGKKANSTGSNQYTNPRICTDSSGNTVVSWNLYSGGKYAGYIQVFNKSGNPVLGTGGATVSTSTDNPRNPFVYSLANNSALVTYGTGGTYDTFTTLSAQKITWGGNGAQTFYFAEGTVRPGFDPYFTVQNLGSEAADISVTYGTGDGSAKTQETTVPTNSRGTINPKDVIPTTDTPSSDFSARVECTNGQPLVVEQPMYFNYKPGEYNWNGGHRVMGTTSPDTVWYFAEGTVRPGFDPYFTVQNLGSEAADISVTYGTGDGSAKTQETTVPTNSRGTINPKDVIPTTDTPSSDFSAKIECTNGQLLVVEQPMYFNYKPGEYNWNGGHRVTGATAPSARWYFAEGTVRPGFNPYYTVLNLGTDTANVKVNYGLGDGSTREQEITVARNSRGTINPLDVIPSADSPVSDFSATVQSTNGQLLVVEQPMYFNYKPGVLNWNGGHRVMGANLASTTWYFAEGTVRPGFDPYLTIQNVGANPAEITVQYNTGDGSNKTQNITLAPNSRGTVNPKEVILSSDSPASDFSVCVRSTNGQMLIVEEPMYFNYKPGVLNWNGGHRVMGYH